MTYFSKVSCVLEFPYNTKTLTHSRQGLRHVMTEDIHADIHTDMYYTDRICSDEYTLTDRIYSDRYTNILYMCAGMLLLMNEGELMTSIEKLGVKTNFPTPNLSSVKLCNKKFLSPIFIFHAPSLYVR